MSTPVERLHVSPVGRAQDARGASRPFDVGSASFGDLLARARGGGGIQTHRPVTFGREVTSDLSAEQLARVAAATDQAEASGAVKALVLIDGQALTIDVLNRQIVGTMSASAPGVLTGIDTMVIAPGATGESASGVGPPTPSMAELNPSLVRALARS